MNTAAQLIDEAQRHGATIVVEGGKARVRGAKLPDALIEQLKAHKDAVMAEVTERMAQDRDRYGKVPPADAPLVANDARLNAATRELVVGYVFRQGRPLHAWVQARGHSFHSETDTEVLAHLVGEFYEGNLEEAVASALRDVDGAYGLAFISADEPGVLVAARKGSPRLVGVGEGEWFVASDASALLSHTRSVAERVPLLR